MIRKVLSLLWKGWKKFAEAIVYVQTRIILFLLYTVILGVTSVIVRAFRVNVMGEERGNSSYWHKKEPLDESPEGLARQF